MGGRLFGRATKVLIYATTAEYALDLLSLSHELREAVTECVRLSEVHIRCKRSCKESWLCRAWSTDLEFKFHSNGWAAKLRVGKGAEFDDVLTISRLRRRKLRRSSTMAMARMAQ